MAARSRSQRVSNGFSASVSPPSPSSPASARAAPVPEAPAAGAPVPVVSGAVPAVRRSPLSSSLGTPIRPGPLTTQAPPTNGTSTAAKLSRK